MPGIALALADTVVAMLAEQQAGDDRDDAGDGQTDAAPGFALLLEALEQSEGAPPPVAEHGDSRLLEAAREPLPRLHPCLRRGAPAARLQADRAAARVPRARLDELSRSRAERRPAGAAAEGQSAGHAGGRLDQRQEEGASTAGGSRSWWRRPPSGGCSATSTAQPKAAVRRQPAADRSAR